MKRLILLFALIPVLSSAQQQPGMDPAKMQEMMKRFQDPAAIQEMQQQAEAMQRCMEEIDKKKIEALRVRAEAAGEEIEALCKAGDKAGALSRGLELSRELQNDATLKKAQECSKGIGEMMGGMFEAQMKEIRELQDDKAPTESDICS